ncbi:hypothetical protein HY991_05535 [Candidatus Micrarchaeota archaeon]|nr:hypothetical protein [Candidatus Micrarchaeota archaeon]
MKIGLIDCIYNKIDARDMASKILESKIPDLEIIRFSAPDSLKVPVAAKKMFSEGADVILVFLTVGAEEKEALDLVHEKIIDVEVYFGKLVFFCILFDDEWRREEQLGELSEKKLAASVELISRIVHAPEMARQMASAERKEVSPALGEALNFMNQPTEEEDIHSLF